MITDLTEFLLARIAEDEQQTARSWPFSNAKIAAECEAKRRVVAELAAMAEQDEAGYHDRAPLFALSILRLVALPYADHPDYDETWRP